MDNKFKEINTLMLLKMGCTVSYEPKPIIDYEKVIYNKYCPKENCPPEQIAIIKESNLLLIKDYIIKQWETAKQEKSTYVKIDVRQYLCIDVETTPILVSKVYPKGNVILCGRDSVYVPKRYKNGSEIIITYNEIATVIESVVDVPYIIIRDPHNIIFFVHIVQKI